jgi:hypothetical protein
MCLPLSQRKRDGGQVERIEAEFSRMGKATQLCVQTLYAGCHRGIEDAVPIDIGGGKVDIVPGITMREVSGTPYGHSANYNSEAGQDKLRFGRGDHQPLLGHAHEISNSSVQVTQSSTND